MNILHHKTAKSHHDFTSRADLMAPATLLERLGSGKIVDRMMPAPGSNRGYRHGTERRVGRHRPSRDALLEVNRRLLKAGLQDRDQVTLDIDASVVDAKKTARRTCKGKRGYVPMFGHIAESALPGNPRSFRHPSCPNPGPQRVEKPLFED